MVPRNKVISSRGDIHIVCSSGGSKLIKQSAFFDSPKALEWLLARGIQPKIADQVRWFFRRPWPTSALARAALHGTLMSCEVLLENGTPMDSNALHMVIRRIPLKEQRARRYAVIHPHYKPLTSQQRIDMLDLLLSHGADINHLETDLGNRVSNGGRLQPGCTPLQLAVAMEDLQVVRYLIGKGAAPDALDAKGRSLLEMAPDLSDPENSALKEALKADEKMVKASA